MCALPPYSAKWARWTFALWGALLAGGCERATPARPPPVAQDTPVPAIRRVTAGAAPWGEMEVSPPTLPPDRGPAEAEVLRLEPHSQAGQTLPDRAGPLEALYTAGTTPPGKRHEIVLALGQMQNAEALAALGRIFTREKLLESRLEILQVAADFSDPALNPARFTLFQHAIAPTQPLLIRLNALQSLRELDDPRSPALLESVRHDENSIVREAVENILSPGP